MGVGGQARLGLCQGLGRPILDLKRKAAFFFCVQQLFHPTPGWETSLYSWMNQTILSPSFHQSSNAYYKYKMQFNKGYNIMVYNLVWLFLSLNWLEIPGFLVPCSIFFFPLVTVGKTFLLFLAELNQTISPVCFFSPHSFCVRQKKKMFL